MAFFRTVSFSDLMPAIGGAGVVLRAPQMSDFAEWTALREASRSFLTPWEPTWPADDLSRASFRRRIKRYSEDQRSDLAYAFFVFRKHDDVLVGGLTLANIRRGCAQAGSLGYWMGVTHARQGHMTAAVNAIIPFAVRDAEAAPDRSRMYPGQCGVGPAFGKDRIQARGVCAAISVHRRDLAGPFALCAPQGRSVALTQHRGWPWGRHGFAVIRLREAGSLSKKLSNFNASGP